MRSLPALMMLWISTNVFAVDFVDPEDLGPDAPDMLIPERIVASCSKSELGISLNEPIPDKRRFDTPAVTEYPLAEEALNIIRSCQHGNYLVEAMLKSTPPRETGWCAAVHSASLQLHVNKKVVLNSQFADHCTGWGITSVKVINRVQDELGDLVVCGYWDVPSELFEKGGSVKTYRCDKYPLDKMYEKSLRFVDGAVQ